MIIFILIIILLLCLCDNNNSNRKTHAMPKREITPAVSQQKQNQGSNKKTRTNKAKTVFDSKYYYSSKKYCISPSKISNRDMNRPYGNNYDQKSLIINYPQMYYLNNMKDEKKRQKINLLIYKEAAFGAGGINYLDYKECKIDYSIMTCNEHIISILFSGIYVPFPSYHESRIKYGITIDIDKGCLMDLSDFYTINAKFMNKINVTFRPTKYSLYLANMFLEPPNLIKDTAKSFVDDYKHYDHRNDFYIKNNNILGIMMGITDPSDYIVLEGKIKKG